MAEAELHPAQPSPPGDQHHHNSSKPARPPPSLLPMPKLPLLNLSKAPPVPVSSARWLAQLRTSPLLPNPNPETKANGHSGVAVGSSIGHAIGGFFGGGSSAPAQEQPQDNSVAAEGNTAGQQNNWGARSCDVDAKQFTQCLDQNQGNMQICGWYLEQLVSGCR